MKKIKNKECPICLETFRFKDMIETNCHHLFCNDCFFIILSKSDKKCALCRKVQNEWKMSSIVTSIEIIDCYKIE